MAEPSVQAGTHKQVVKPAEGMEEEQEEDWWQFEVARLMGVETAMQQEGNK